MTVGGSIGIALHEASAASTDDLLRDADAAMYCAKSRGRDRYELFEPSMHTRALHLFELNTDLQKGLDQDQFVVHYQPILDLAGEELQGVEALVRWQHPEYGLLGPGEFVPLAETTGLIRPLTAHVLDAALRQCRAWQDAGRALSVAVNLSTRCLLDLTLPDQITALLEDTAVAPERLVLEITESSIMTDPTRALQILNRLHALGVQLAIDDFGTGYSSLSYLHRFPVDMLKIDRSFVERLSHASDNAELARTIVRLGQSLQLVTVAEGVEDSAQFLALRRMGCDVGQGYYFGKPMESEEISRLLRDDAPAPARKPATTG
jgi:EAL domain-containing protein (putative c-di-GMP-specific phosphodiesterase class I)